MSFQNIFQIVPAFCYYFGIHVKMHKNTMKCIIIFQIWNKMLIQYANIKCDRDMDLYMYVCVCIYSVF